MNCTEAAEFVSALCDGATVSPSAAEHISACESCRERLRDYVDMGAELRRVASLESAMVPLAPLQLGKRGVTSNFWQKGRKMMRIPRLAFGSLLAAVVVLGSGWARQIVLASQHGSVLLVQYTAGSGPASFCALSAVDRKFDSCGGLRKVKSGWLVYGITVLSKNGDTATLGLRAGLEPPDSSAGTYDIDNFPQRQYQWTPGQTISVDVNGFGTMTFTGQWIDHIPAIAIGLVGDNPYLDPGPDELRFFSPLLLQNDQVLGGLEGASTSLDHPGEAVDLYLAGVGRFDVSLSPLPGAVRGQVHFNRVAFTVAGRAYEFVTGAPVCRRRDIWVLFDPHPSGWTPAGHSFLSTVDVSKLTPPSAQH